MATFDIATGTTTVDGDTLGIVAGDTVRITSGARGRLVLQNITGASGNVVTIINNGGQSIITTTSSWGIEVTNCEYIQLTGTGDAGSFYGFDITGATNAGVFFRAGTRRYECDHVYVHDITNAGIRSYSKYTEIPDDPDWVLYDTEIHDCYIDTVTTEGMYLGNDSDVNFSCDGIEVYDCIVEACGYEGIQIKNSTDVEIYDNLAQNCGTRTETVATQPGAAYDCQRSEANIHHNIAFDSNKGIELNHVLSGTIVHHNLLVRSGIYRGGPGIQWYTDVASVYHNTVVDSAQNGIYAGDSVTDGLIYNNFVVGWGSGYYCIRANGLNWTTEVYNNVCTDDIDDADFVDPDNDDYHLEDTSPAVAQGDDGSDCGCYPLGSGGSASESASESVSPSPTAESASPSMSPSASAAPSGCIDFETGDLSQFDSTSGGGISADAAAAMEESYGFKVVISDTTPRFGTIDSNGMTRFRIGFYFDPNGVTMASYDDFHIVGGNVSGGSDYRIRFRYISATGYDLRVGIQLDGLGWTDSTAVVIADTPHWVEADFLISSAPAANDGFAKLWIDSDVTGAPDTSVLNVDNDTLDLDCPCIGAVYGLDAGTSGTIYFDYICMNETGDPIGEPQPGSASESASPSVSLSPSASESASGSASESASPSASVPPVPPIEPPEFTAMPYLGAVETLPWTPTNHESTGLAIVAYRPLIGSYTPRGALVDDGLGQRYTAYSHIIQANGGWWSARLSLDGNLVDMEDWFDRGLGRHIEVYSPSLVQIWAGFVNQVTLSAGSLTATRGPLLDIANRASVAYTPITDAVAVPPTTGEATVTAIAEDEDSQARYGIVEKVVNGGQLLDDGVTDLAEHYRDTYLAENAWPRTSEDVWIGTTSEPRVELELLGYVHWFQAYVLDIDECIAVRVSQSDIPTGKLQQIVNADPNELFSRDYDRMTFNGLLTSQYEGATRDAWTAIQELVSLGDASNNRMLFGVYANQQVVYANIPTTTLYQHRIADRGMSVEPYGGGMEIRPWDVRAGQWMFLPDFLAGRSQPAEVRRDPRYMFIESVEFSAPYGLQVRGGTSDTLAQLVAKGGLWA